MDGTQPAEAETYDGAIFVQSRPRPRGAGPFAPLLTAAGWAGASEKRWGSGWVVTRAGVLSAAQARSVATSANDEVALGWSSRLPDVGVTLTKDVRGAVRASFQAPELKERPWAAQRVPFVWQRHDPFDKAGFGIAAEHDVPLVMAVHAILVDEAAGWGVKRPGWGRWMRTYGEIRLMARSDLIACVSEEVADLVRVAIPARSEDVVVVGSGIDLAHFQSDAAAGADVRARLGIPPDAFVIGWHGSFRKFHGLEDFLQAFVLIRPKLPESRVLLVGHGAHRAGLLSLAEELGIQDSVISPGEVAFDEMPAFLSAMDVGLTLTDEKQHFHYSPLKLREYQSCGVPVIVSRAGELGSLRDREDAMVVEAGDHAALGDALVELAGSPELRARLAARGAALVQRESWDAKLDELLAALRQRRMV